MNIQSLPEHFHEWNESMVQRHDPELFHRHPRAVVRWVEGLRVQTAVKALQLKPEHSLLDVGCGAGNVLEKLVAREKHGIDLSVTMTERAKKRLGGSAQILLGDAEKLPYADGTFDRVLCTSLLSHVYRPETVLLQAYRVLKSGGILSVSVSDEAGIERGLKLARLLLLDRLLLGGSSAAAHAGVYSSEYHLHRFDLQLLQTFSKNLPKPCFFKKVPFIFPVHLIVAYRKPA